MTRRQPWHRRPWHRRPWLGPGRLVCSCSWTSRRGASTPHARLGRSAMSPLAWCTRARLPLVVARSPLSPLSYGHLEIETQPHWAVDRSRFVAFDLGLRDRDQQIGPCRICLRARPVAELSGVRRPPRHLCVAPWLGSCPARGAPLRNLHVACPPASARRHPARRLPCLVASWRSCERAAPFSCLAAGVGVDLLLDRGHP